MTVSNWMTVAQTMIRVPLVVAGLLALWAGAGLAAPPQMPSPAAIDGLRSALHDQVLPPATAGKVTLRDIDSVRGAGSTFARVAPDLPQWRGKGIMLDSGVHRLPELAAQLPEPGWLDCVAQRCTLSAPLLVGAGATLVIEGIDLQLSQDHGAALLSWGRLLVSDSVLRAWNLARDLPAETDGEGKPFRPFVAGYAASHTLIRRSDLLHLGHQASMSYGLSFGTELRRETVRDFPSVDMIGNRVLDVYFGFFSFDADGVNVIDNHIAESHVYGIDPHDDTRNMLIHGNYVLGSRRSHGIILSRRIHDTVVSYNVSTGNAKAGFFIDKGSHDVLFTGNDSFLNKAEGMVLHEVSRIDVLGNRFHNNGGDGVRLRASEAVQLDGNTVTRNGRFGMSAYDWSAARRPPNAEEAGQIVPMRLGLLGNRVHGNSGGDCRLKGDARVTSGQPFMCPVPPVPVPAALPQHFGPDAGNAP